MHGGEPCAVLLHLVVAEQFCTLRAAVLAGTVGLRPWSQSVLPTARSVLICRRSLLCTGTRSTSTQYAQLPGLDRRISGKTVLASNAHQGRRRGCVFHLWGWGSKDATVALAGGVRRAVSDSRITSILQACAPNASALRGGGAAWTAWAVRQCGVNGPTGRVHVGHSTAIGFGVHPGAPVLPDEAGCVASLARYTDTRIDLCEGRRLHHEDRSRSGHALTPAMDGHASWFDPHPLDALHRPSHLDRAPLHSDRSNRIGDPPTCTMATSCRRHGGCEKDRTSPAFGGRSWRVDQDYGSDFPPESDG